MRPIYVLVCVLFGVGSLVSAIISVVHGAIDGMLIATGLLAVVALFSPILLLKKNLSPIEPIQLVFLYVLIGTTFASVYLVVGSGYRHTYTMVGEDLAFFLRGCLWVVVGIALFSMAYALTTLTIPTSLVDDLSSRALSLRALGIVSIIFCLVGLAATAYFISITGGISAESISKKRWIVLDSGSEVQYGGGGYLRLLASLPLPVSLLSFAYALHVKPKAQLLVWLCVSGCFLSSIALPFLTNLRSEVILTVLQHAVVLTAFRGVKLAWFTMAFIAALAFFSIMTTLRYTAQGEDRSVSLNTFEALASSGNGLSLYGTAIITQRVPEYMPYKLGASYLTWVYAPIPRSLWPNKPALGLGREIRSRLISFGTRTVSGRPPGFLGEGYINFGPIGLIVTALVFGCGVRVFWNSVGVYAGSNPFAAVFYVMLAPPICQYCNSELSAMIVRLVSESASIFLMIFALMFVSRLRLKANLV